MVRRWRGRNADRGASCMEVMRVLQSYLDGQTDDVTTQRVARHLDACRRCGLEAATYREIRGVLSRRRGEPDPDTIARLRQFAEQVRSEPGPDEVTGA